MYDDGLEPRDRRHLMPRIQGFLAVVLIAACVPVLFVDSASGQQKGGGKQAAPQGPLPPVLENYSPLPRSVC